MTAAGYSSREARAREFVAGLPTAGSVIFVQDRYGQQAVRDLVILTHGVRVNEATSIFVAVRPEDEAQHLVENRRPVFRHPDLIDFRSGITTTSPVDDRPCVPRRGLDGATGRNGSDGGSGSYDPLRSRIGTDPRRPNPVPPVNPTETVFGYRIDADRPRLSVRPAALDTMRDWSGLTPVAGTGPEPEGDLVIATVHIIHDRRSPRPYLVVAPSILRGTYVEPCGSLAEAVAMMPSVACRAIRRLPE